MELTQKIEQFISDCHFDKAIKALDEAIVRNPNDPYLWYLRGKTYWRVGNKAAAISDFEEAVHINPDSPASLALEMTHSVMNFYNPDLLNP